MNSVTFSRRVGFRSFVEPFTWDIAKIVTAFQKAYDLMREFMLL